MLWSGKRTVSVSRRWAGACRRLIKIKVDTFNFTRNGLLHGRVLDVSQDAIVRDASDTNPRRGRARQSCPGNDLTVEIKTGSRRIISICFRHSSNISKRLSANDR